MGAPEEPRHDPYAALRFRDYRLYVLGWVISVIGTQVQDVAVGWEVLQRLGAGPGMSGIELAKKASLALGLVGGVQAVPVILLSLPGGHLADRYDRRKVVMAGALAVTVCAVGLFLVSTLHGPILLLYLLLGISSAARALGWPARSSLVPRLVPHHAFPNAATWNSSFFQVASVAGPALGGLLISFTVAGAYLIDAAAMLVFFTALAMMRLPPRQAAPGGALDGERAATFGGLLAGLRFVWRTKVVLATITLDLFAVLFGGATALLPIYASQVLAVGAVGFGWLKAAPAIGALVSALLLAHLPPMRRAGRSMLWAVAGFGVATIVFGLSQSYWLSLLALALTGAFDNVSVVVRHTLVQVLPPDSMRGRVAAVNNVFIGASNQLGELESGLVGRVFGPVAAVVSGGVGTLLVVGLVSVLWPQVRRLGSLHEVTPVDDPAGRRRKSNAASGQDDAGRGAAAAEPIADG